MEKELTLLGKRIAKLRNSRNITQEVLAEMVDRTPNHISKLELAMGKPSFELLVNIAKALDVEMYELFMFNETTESKNAKEELNKLINSENEETVNLVYKIYRTLLS